MIRPVFQPGIIRSWRSFKGFERPPGPDHKPQSFDVQARRTINEQENGNERNDNSEEGDRHGFSSVSVFIIRSPPRKVVKGMLKTCQEFVNSGLSQKLSGRGPSDPSGFVFLDFTDDPRVKFFTD
jgi:hypothetical protein